MSKHLLLSIAIAAAVVTPVLAEDPPTSPAITRANERKAEAEAREAQYKAEKAAADARFAPLSQFAGNGTSQLDEGGGAMETAYLSAVSMRNVAAEIDRRVVRHLPRNSVGPAAPGIIVLTDTDTLSFDRISAFEAETEGIIRAYNEALGQQPADSCEPPPPTQLTESADFPGVIPIAGAVLSVLQSETHVSGVDGLGDDGMLIAALAEAAPNRYVQQSGLFDPHTLADDPVYATLHDIQGCEARARALLAPPSRPTDAQKARLTSLLERSVGLYDRLTRAADDGSVPLAAVLRQSQLFNQTNRYILRVKLNRAGGTLITRKNIWTALGAPAILTSGGVIASFRLVDRQNGRLFFGGTVICRTGLTGLRSALALQHGDIICADENTAEDRLRRSNVRTEARDSSRRLLHYDNSIFTAQE